MEIIVNGKPYQLDHQMTIASFITTLGMSTRFVAVAKNGFVVERQEFVNTHISDGDRLEIVRPVGGG